MATQQDARAGRRLPTAVIALGAVSFLTDVSSDMIFPLLPLFLVRNLGATPLFVGVLEGAAESMASFLKLLSGYVADRLSRRKPLVVIGYAVSAVMRPFIGLATLPWHVLVVRLSDRFGKGVRSSPRDALIADVTQHEDRGRAYGFHRAMDNAGAVFGPALASLLLLMGLQVRSIFFLAAVPGLVAVVTLIFGVRELPREAVDPLGAPQPDRPSEPSAAALAVSAPVANDGAVHNRRRLVRYWIVLGLFSAGNPADAFLLLRARELGVSIAEIPALWMIHNAIKAALSTWTGGLSDRLGRGLVISLGWGMYALSLVLLLASSSAWHVWIFFAVYGVYYALVEGSERALVADLAPRDRRGRSFAIYHTVLGVAALPASIGYGYLAERYGAPLPLTLAAMVAATAALLMRWWVRPARPLRARG